jgi:hypothetical protein
MLEEVGALKPHLEHLLELAVVVVAVREEQGLAMLEQ